MIQPWLETGGGNALLCEEARQAAAAFENIFGDQFLQVGVWGDPALVRRYARTRRYTVLAASRGPGVEFVSLPEDLAVATDSVDAVFLPHTIETAEDPHAVLREVDRVLRPDGQIVITAFNPWGFWGARHYLSRRKFPAGVRRMVSESRLRDWLRLLDCQVQPAHFYHFSAPLYRSSQSEEPAPTAEVSAGEWPPLMAQNRGWNPLASCYLLVARKEVFTLTRIRPAFRRRTRLVGSLVNPTTRNAA